MSRHSSSRDKFPPACQRMRSSSRGDFRTAASKDPANRKRPSAGTTRRSFQCILPPSSRVLMASDAGDTVPTAAGDSTVENLASDRRSPICPSESHPSGSLTAASILGNDSADGFTHTLACNFPTDRNSHVFAIIMNFTSLITITAVVTTAAFFSSCANIPTGGGSGLKAYHAYDRPTKLPSNPNNVRVKVSLSKQRTYVMEGSEVLLAMPVSVGSPGSSTPAGTFRIFNKEAKRRANTHGYAYSKKNHAKRPPLWLVFQGHAHALLVRVQARLRFPHRLGETSPVHPRLHPHARKSRTKILPSC
jgi:hypothetical protein